MGLFSFGGSKTDSFSRGSSSSIDQSISGSASGGFSRSGSESTGRSLSEQQIAFEDVFARLFGSAEGAAGALDPSLLTDTANQLFSGGKDFLKTLGGDPGTKYMESRLSGDNAVLQEQIDLLGEDLGQFFAEEINPAITADAIGGGALGGGRQGVAQGAAAAALGEEFRRGVTALRAGDIAARDAVASQVAGNALTGAETGLASLPGLLGIAEQGTFAGIEPYERLAAILGGPTVLTSAASESESSSFGTAEDFARAFAASFGRSKSSTESGSKSRAFSFGPGK